MKLNNDKWEFFNFSQIFQMKNGFYNKKPESDGTGKIPFIGATDRNNGVTGYFTLEEIESSSKTGSEPNQALEDKIFPKNAVCVTNNGSVGYAYFQDGQFTCSHDVNPLYLKNGEFNKYTGLFVATIIMHDRYRWGYGRKWRPKRMIKSKLKLPILRDEDSNPVIDDTFQYSSKGYIPDWEFMEKYMKTLNFDDLITNNNENRKELETEKWCPFKLSNLDINIYKAKSHAKIDMNFSKVRDERRLPFISRTEQNNSVDGWVLIDENNKYELGNALVIGDTTATISYQPNPFVCGDHIVVIRAGWLDKYTGLFVKTLLDKERYRYSYGRAFKMELIQDTEIRLPSKDGSVPDWEFIRSYIKSMPYADLI